MPRSIQEILDHADELAKRFEEYEPAAGDERPVEEYMLERVALTRARSEQQVVDAIAAARRAGISLAEDRRNTRNVRPGRSTALQRPRRSRITNRASPRSGAATPCAVSTDSWQGSDVAVVPGIAPADRRGSGLERRRGHPSAPDRPAPPGDRPPWPRRRRNPAAGGSWCRRYPSSWGADERHLAVGSGGCGVCGPLSADGDADAVVMSNRSLLDSWGAAGRTVRPVQVSAVRVNRGLLEGWRR